MYLQKGLFYGLRAKKWKDKKKINFYCISVAYTKTLTKYDYLIELKTYKWNRHRESERYSLRQEVTSCPEGYHVSSKVCKHVHRIVNS